MKMNAKRGRCAMLRSAINSPFVILLLGFRVIKAISRNAQLLLHSRFEIAEKKNSNWQHTLSACRWVHVTHRVVMQTTLQQFHT